MPTRISFSFQVAALSYQAPEMNGLECKLEGFDRDWYAVGRNSSINYSNLPYGKLSIAYKRFQQRRQMERDGTRARYPYSSSFLSLYLGVCCLYTIGVMLAGCRNHLFQETDPAEASAGYGQGLSGKRNGSCILRR